MRASSHVTKSNLSTSSLSLSFSINSPQLQPKSSSLDRKERALRSIVNHTRETSGLLRIQAQDWKRLNRNPHHLFLHVPDPDTRRFDESRGNYLCSFLYSSYCLRDSLVEKAERRAPQCGDPKVGGVEKALHYFNAVSSTKYLQPLTSLPHSNR
jgi:hypothetical protein